MDQDWKLEERVAKVIREECLRGEGSPYEKANQLARAAIEEIRRAGALSFRQGEQK